VALNSKIALVGFDKQTSGKGTLAATAKYAFGLRSGGPLKTALEQNAEELTMADRSVPSVYRTSFLNGAEFTTRAWAKMTGALLYYCLGTDTPTGAGDPFTHTITPSTTPVYTTLFARLDTEYHKVRDAKVDEVTIAWDGTEPAELTASVQGTVGTFFTTSWTPTIDESADQCFYPAGGTFQLDTNSGTPVTADVTAGSITFRNNLQPIMLSRSTEPDDNWPGGFECEISLSLIPVDNDLWQKIITGTGAATVKTDAPIYGSANLKFIYQSAPERSLTITATKVAFTGDYPEADAGGGPVTLELVGQCVKPAGATVTCVVLNDQAATAYTAGS
jgi:hypothetical protein